MRKYIDWGILFVIICAVFCGCVAEKPDPEDYDVDKIVAELVEITKHHAKQQDTDKPKEAKNNNGTNKQKPLADKEEHVSPFGFGPYPEIPADFPDQNIFDRAPQDSANHELISRVWLELWKRGVRGITGMSISNQTGMVTPTIRGIAYADWEPIWDFGVFGFGTLYTSISGHPKDMIGPPEEPGPFSAGMKIARGVKVFHESKGIDPYLLLKIPKP